MTSQTPSCCGPGGPGGPGDRPPGVPTPVAAATVPVVHDEVALAGGVFAMGNPFPDGFWGDGETPVHAVELSPFAVDVTAVTVAQYEAFVDATGYRTDAEGYGDSLVFHLLVQAGDDDLVGFAGGAPWWRLVRGADWRHPYGPRSGADPDHPVVHVSHHDAAAYCAWAGRALPTEAQWEYAARGGHAGRRFPWGDRLETETVADDGTPVVRHQANVWQGDFPTANTRADGYVGTAPVRTYDPNDYGLFQMVGNVWEWCADRFAADTYGRDHARGLVLDPSGAPDGDRRVIRGGSYLCHHSYCTRYRVAARSANTPESATGNTGFRTVRNSS